MLTFWVEGETDEYFFEILFDGTTENLVQQVQN